MAVQRTFSWHRRRGALSMRLAMTTSLRNYGQPSIIRFRLKKVNNNATIIIDNKQVCSINSRKRMFIRNKSLCFAFLRLNEKRQLREVDFTW